MTKTKLIVNCLRLIGSAIAQAYRMSVFACKHEYKHYKMYNQMLNTAKDPEINDAFAKDHVSLVGED